MNIAVISIISEKYIFIACRRQGAARHKGRRAGKIRAKFTFGELNSAFSRAKFAFGKRNTP